ncbi:NADH-dependent dehydrogenase [Bryobacterales bacterium F-183]|nr:NADH-dependent dehydrogenase [Bryobacterales bacterium F-183]
MTTPKISRRSFAATAMTALSYSRVMGANEKLRMGYIGVGNRGDQVHDGFLEHGDAVTAAVCDLRDEYMDFAIKKSRGATPRKYTDYRKLIEDKEIDAVAIATPDHWHAIMFGEACLAGKDVYCEKPLSLTQKEGRYMVNMAEKTKRVVQVGIHRRSAKFLQEAAEYVRSGKLGKVTVARGFHIQNEWPNGIGNAPDTAPANAKEWDAWLGPAPMVPYNKNRTYYDFRWFYNYSGGQLTNFGVHYIDMLRWALGKDSPKSVAAIGGKYAVQDNREIPDTLEVIWDYGDALIIFCQYNANAAPSNLQGSEMEIRGTLGTMYLHGNRWEVVPEKVTDNIFPARTPLDRTAEKAYNPSKKTRIEPAGSKGSADTAFHARNFIDCVKSRAKCNCDVETGYLSTSATQLGNIALKVRAQLDWDAKAERFTNNDKANQYLGYEYRKPYKLPS